jgi:hypothetical protein
VWFPPRYQRLVAPVRASAQGCLPELQPDYEKNSNFIYLKRVFPCSGAIFGGSSK